MTRIKRNLRKPLLVPLTPLAVAAFFSVRGLQGVPPAVLNASRAAMAAVAAVGTYLMTLRPAQQRRDMAEALTGQRMPPEALLPMDAATHWLPAAVLAWDVVTQPRPPPLSWRELGAVAAVTAALTAAYVRTVDSAFMYQMPEGPLVAGFLAVYAPSVVLMSFLPATPQVCPHSV